MKTLALISTYNKEGVTSIARALADQGMELVATGKTRTLLESDGLKVMDISELTKEPERFGGRLKTLSTIVLGAILFRPGQDEAEWPYDFRIGAVVCNFYPFATEGSKSESIDEMIEWIDVGGPTMVRSAAKNHKHVDILTDPSQYARFITAVSEDRPRLRERLALEAFERTAELDRLIAREFTLRMHSQMGGGALTYGENPHQTADFIPNRRLGLKLFGKASYNNWLDLEAALRFVLPFDNSQPAVSVIKHGTLCGASVGETGSSADQVFHYAWEGDTISRFGGIIGFNHLPSAAVTDLLEKKFIEAVVVPKTDASLAWAETLIAKKPRLRILLLDFHSERTLSKTETYRGLLGELTQTIDRPDTRDIAINPDRLFECFGSWASACTKSNAMILCGRNEKERISFMAGAGQGQPNRVDALKLLALPRAKDFSQRLNIKIQDLSCFSDGFLPFADSVETLAEAGIKNLIQPGGSKSDDEVAERARQLGVRMVLTGRRHFWH